PQPPDDPRPHTSLLRTQHVRHRFDDEIPLRSFSAETCSTRTRQSIEPRALVVFRSTPGRLDEPFPTEPVKRRIEAAVLDLQQVVGAQPDGLSDAVPVLWAPLQGAQDEQVERTLQDVEWFATHVVDILPP